MWTWGWGVQPQLISVFPPVHTDQRRSTQLISADWGEHSSVDSDCGERSKQPDKLIRSVDSDCGERSKQPDWSSVDSDCGERSKQAKNLLRSS